MQESIKTSFGWPQLIKLRFRAFLLCICVLIFALPTAIAQEQNKQEEAERALIEGQDLFQLGTGESLRAAFTKFNEAREIARSFGDKAIEAVSLFSMGRISDELGEKRKALDYYNQALPLSKATEDEFSEASILNSIGKIYADSGEKRKALQYFNQSLTLWKTLRDKSSNPETLNNISIYEATTLNNIGSVYSDLGEKQKALQCYNQALSFHEVVKDEFGEPRILNNIGLLYSELGEKQKALQYFARALSLNKRVFDKAGQATTLNNIAGVYDNLGAKQKALEYYNLALIFWRLIEDKAGEAASLNGIGKVYDNLGEKGKALQYYNSALALMRAVESKTDEAKTLNNIGSVYFALGENEKALNYYNQALLSHKEVEDKSGEATVLNNIGGLFAALGEKRKALEYYEQALSLRRGVGDRAGEAGTLNNIGAVHFASGDNQKALQIYEQALQLRKAVGDRAGEAGTLSNIGAAHFASGNRQKALEYYVQALPLHKATGAKAGEAATLNNIGLAYFALGEKRKALEYYEQALLLRRTVEDTAGEAETLHNMMFVAAALNKSNLAIFYGKQAVNTYQLLRTGIRNLDKEIQRTYLKSVDSTYRYLVVELLKNARWSEAHQILNLFKDEQFFDFVEKGVKEEKKQATAASMARRESENEALYQQTMSRLGNPGRESEELKRESGQPLPPSEVAQPKELDVDFKTARDEVTVMFRKIERDFSQAPTADDVIAKTNDTIKLQGALKELSMLPGKKAIAVYTFIGEDDFYALVATSNDLIAVSSPVKGARLNNQAKQLWALLQSDEYDPKPLSKEIYDLVFKPIKDKLVEENKLDKVLPEGTTLIWSLDGNLRYLPMAALYDGEKYLVERYNNVVFTRADSERWTRNISQNWTGVGFGSSHGGNVEYLKMIYSFDDLLNVTKELNAIFKTNNSRSGVFEGEIFSDLNFTRQSMTDALKQRHSLVHISSHFKFSPGDSARSFLLLGDRTVFPLNEMKQQPDLFQGVELLTLSACETAAQWANSDGREVDGFAELAQRLGAGAVMATLWKVRDDSSYWLMRDFYQQKRDVSNQTKVESLRQAQTALLNGAAKVMTVAQAEKSNVKKRSSNSIFIKILSAGKEPPANNEDGVVYVEAKYAKPYNWSAATPYGHPYFWSPFVLFGNWH